VQVSDREDDAEREWRYRLCHGEEDECQVKTMRRRGMRSTRELKIGCCQASEVMRNSKLSLR
jgi:hypothetical protein